MIYYVYIISIAYYYICEYRPIEATYAVCTRDNSLINLLDLQFVSADC